MSLSAFPLRTPARGLVCLALVASVLGAQEPGEPKGGRGGHELASDNNGQPPAVRGDADDPAGRLEWWRQRIGGDLSPEFMARTMREAERQRLLYPDHFLPEGAGAARAIPDGTPLAVAIGASTWTNLGPTKSNKIQNGVVLTKVNSGRLRTILPDPVDPNTLYVLSSGGGLWKTTNLLDANPVWRAISDMVGSTMGGAVAFGKVKSGANTVLYLGLGDPFDYGVGGFMVKSSDAGNTWSSAIQLTGTAGATTYTATRILDVKVDDTGATDMILVGTDVGLFRSTDGGLSYSLVNDANLNGKRVWSLARTGVNTWIVSVETNYGNAASSGNLYRSTNGGATWGTVTTPPPSAQVSRMTLAVAAPGEATAYCFAATTGDGDQKDLYRSTDGGVTWTATSTNSTTTPATTNGDQPNNDYMNGQAFYNHMVLVDPTAGTPANRTTVYVGGNLSAAKNTNSGLTGGTPATKWNVITNWLPGGASGTGSLPYVHADFHCAAFSTAGGTNRIFLGSDGGLFISSDGGATWDDTKNIGIVSHLPYALASGPLNNCDANSVLMGLQDNGTHNRIGGTGVFDQTRGGDGFGVGWSQATNAYSMSSYVYNTIQRCTTNPPDDQSKWGNFVGGMTGTGSSAAYYFVTPIISAPPGADSTGTVFYTYSNTGTNTNSKKIFRTSGGGNWTSLGTLPTPAALGTKLGVRGVSHGVGVHPTDPNRIAAACISGYLVTTTNAGGAWTARDLISLVPASGGRTWQGFNAGVTWVDNNILFVCSESTGANSIHVVRSADGGATWAAAETGLPDLPVTKIVVDPGDASGNTLYAATWLGVYRTTNSGTSWSLFGSGLPQSRVADLYIHPAGGFLRAALWGRGIWQVGPTPVYTAPVFSSQPAGGGFSPGTPFTLTAAVSNTYPAVTYQWRRNGVDLANGGTESISGATTPSLTVSNPICGSAGDYVLVATNCAGSGVSSTATLTSAVAAPVITTQPANLRYNTGTNFTLSVAATGTGLTYQWRRAGVNLTNTAPYSNVATSTLTVTNATAGVAGTFDCVVTGAGGCSVTSSTATLSSSANVAPNITVQPQDTTVTAPNTATFTTTFGGGRVGAASPTITVTWRKNGANLANGSGGYSWTNSSLTINNSTGTASSTLTINPTADALDGALYSCNVSSTAGNVTSRGAELTVLRRYTPATAVSITPSTSLPVSKTGGSWPVTFTAAGSGSLLQGTATPAPAAAYQYQFWLYLDNALGWVMVRDFSTTATYTLPTWMMPGSYGIGVDCRTSPAVSWDVFNAIDYFDVLSSVVAGPGEILKPRARPPFQGVATSVTVLPPDGRPRPGTRRPESQ
ncbi:MAG: immunoglobulin domain-containing protein [Holophagaceae bacterium]